MGLWIGLGDFWVYTGSWRFRAGFLTQRVKASGSGLPREVISGAPGGLPHEAGVKRGAG